MKKAIVILLIIIFSIIIITQVSFAYSNSVNYNTNIISVIDYYQNGDVDFTNAILRANDVLRSTGGGTLIFPAGDYRIRPGKIFIPSGTKWKGQGSARIYTQENSLYNVALSTEPGARDIIIEDLIFDQRDDASMVPNSSALLGAFFIHITNADNVDINGCTFYVYGVCALLSQSSYSLPTNTIKVYKYKAYFQRKKDTFYDVSVFNIDGRSVYVEDNYIEGIEVSGFKYSKPRTAIEVHMPNGYIMRNVTKNTEIGILHVNWPMLWNTYEPSYRGNLQISDNTIIKAIIGIDVWSSNTLASTVTRNLSIIRNSINLHLDPKSFPAKGISLSDGDKSNSRFENIIIEGNTIQMTVGPNILDPAARMYLLIPGNNTGAMFMNVKSTIDNMEIYNNTVTNFPYSFLNLYRKNNAGENNVHSNIKVYDNNIIECSYSKPYGGIYEDVFNVGKVSNLSIYRNIIMNFSTKIVGELNNLGNVSAFYYSNNIFKISAEANETEIFMPKTVIEPIEQKVIELIIGKRIAKVDGVKTEMDVVPVIVNSRILVPIRFIAEALGLSVHWDENIRNITIIKEGSWISLKLDEDVMIVNGNTLYLDAAPQLIQSRIMIPLRAVAESLNLSVHWDYKTQKITLH